MTEYEIRFNTSAAKEFRKLTPDIQQRVRTAINGLRSTPRPEGVKKLVGGTDLYRIRVGDYRVVYRVDDRAQSIQITRVRHRRDVYE
jgi:mRNA interferase RelE/StbE